MYKQWTKEEFEKHLMVNLNDSYSSAVTVAGLYHALTGEFPKIGLSGHQGSGAEFISRQVKGLTNEDGESC